MTSTLAITSIGIFCLALGFELISAASLNSDKPITELVNDTMHDFKRMTFTTEHSGSKTVVISILGGISLVMGVLVIYLIIVDSKKLAAKMAADEKAAAEAAELLAKAKALAPKSNVPSAFASALKSSFHTTMSKQGSSAHSKVATRSKVRSSASITKMAKSKSKAALNARSTSPCNVSSSKVSGIKRSKSNAKPISKNSKTSIKSAATAKKSSKK